MLKTKIAAVALACLSSIAVAQSRQQQDSGWYLGGSVGRSTTDISDGDLANAAAYLNTLGVTGITYTKSENDTGWKLNLGYQFNQNLAVEGGYADLGKFDTRFNGTYLGTAGTIIADVEGQAWFLDIVGTAPITREFSVFGRVGFNSIRAEGAATVSWAGLSQSLTQSDTNSGIHFGAGLSYSFTPQVAVRGEWERFTGAKINSQSSESDVDLLSVGLQLRF